MNITYEVVRGSFQDLSQVEGNLADPGQDFISGTGSVILQEGQTSVGIPVTILDVRIVSVFSSDSRTGGVRWAWMGLCLSLILSICQTGYLIHYRAVFDKI